MSLPFYSKVTFSLPSLGSWGSEFPYQELSTCLMSDQGNAFVYANFQLCKWGDFSGNTVLSFWILCLFT